MLTKPSTAASNWPTEPTSGRGRSHGTSGIAPFDRWFRYPAGFASDFVGLLLDNLGLSDGTIIDCFAGSGVTGTAALSRGLNFGGIETHPLVAELARLKLAPDTTGDILRAGAAAAREAVSASKKVWNSTAEPDLIQRSFPTDTLQLLLALRNHIKAMADDAAARYLKWALLATLRDVADTKVGWPYQRPGVPRKPRTNDVIARFALRVERIAVDIESIAPERPTGTLIVGDSRDPRVWEQLPDTADACVSSPPYLNNFDYADATRLELFFWGTATTWRQMCEEVRTGMLTATTQQSSIASKRDSIQILETMNGTAPKKILDLVEDIGEAKRRRERRSKEYDQVAPAYFVGMTRVLENLFANLQPGASSLWVVGDSAPYGVYVDTPSLIGELASQLGFDLREDVTLRVRGNRWASADRHQVPLTERLVVFTKPAV